MTVENIAALLGLNDNPEIKEHCSLTVKDNVCEAVIPSTITEEVVELDELDIDGRKLSIKVLERGKSTKICHYYQKGRCERGDKCRFLHINKNNNNRGNDTPTTEGTGDDERRTCRFFMKGKCTKGRQCRFKHPQCRNFANDVPCTYGEKCTYLVDGMG